MILGSAHGGFFRISLLLGAIAGLLAACGRQPPSPAPLEVEIRGCWAFYLPRQVCSLFPNRRLHLWVRTSPPHGKVEIHASRQLLTPRGTEIGGGTYYRLEIPKQADRLTVSLRPPGGGEGAGWSLRLAEPEQPRWMEEVGKMNPTEARKRLEGLRKSAPFKEQTYVLRTLANYAHNDDAGREEKLLGERSRIDHAENRWSGEVESGTQLANLFIQQGRFLAARRALDALRLPAKAPADSKYQIIYARGLLASETGDYRLALKKLNAADELAKRTQHDIYRWEAEQVLASILQELGRSQASYDLFESLAVHLPKLKTPCDRGTLLTNIGWSRLLAAEAGESIQDPTSLLEQARDRFEEGPCTLDQQLNAHLNLALDYQRKGQLPAARIELDRARLLRSDPNLSQRLWSDDLEARMAIAEGHPELALGLYQELENKSRLALSPEGRLRALLGQANAQRALRHSKEAIDALAAADLQIDEQSRHIPVHEGRDTFLAQEEAVTRKYLDLLLQTGQKERALDLARRSRSRLLRQIEVGERLAQLKPEEQRAWSGFLAHYRAVRQAIDKEASTEWTLADSERKRAREAQAEQLADAQDALDRALAVRGASGEGKLASPAPDEVILIYHPLTEGRWAGFAATARGIEIERFKLRLPLPADPKERAQILLKPSRAFQAAIASSKQVRVLPYGPLRAVDFHALPFDGDKPLLATHRVVYSLDLPVHPSPPPPGGQPEALIVSNPNGNLREADDEAATVEDSIRSWQPRWRPVSLRGREARSNAVLKALPEATYFHYAGHGVFGGFAGWASELPLADNSSLALGEVLSLSPRVPKWVVLSACDAARTSEEAPGEGIGLANAFLLAGSQGVVAAMQQVPDESARALMRELYGGWKAGEDLPSQLRRAQLACHEKNPSACASWASFRLLVP